MEGREGKVVLHVVRQRVWEKSDNKAHVTGGTALDTDVRFQAVHKLTNCAFDDLYPAHFYYVFVF